MAKRHIEIEMTCEPEQYNAVANLLWHVLKTQGISYQVFQDDQVSSSELNDDWDALGKSVRWRN